MPKNVEPNSGEAPGHFSAHSCGSSNGWSPSPIRCCHSIKWSTINVSPSTIVASSHFRAEPSLPRLAAETANTIVNELDSSTNVIMLENTMLGLNGNGVGQFTLEARA